MPMAPNDKNEDNSVDQIIIPLHAEEVSIGKEHIATGCVKVSTVTHSRQQIIEQLLQSERVVVERVPVGKVVARAPDVRTEGDVTIIPVVEEAIVVQRQLVLKEEFRIRKIRQTHNYQVGVVLRQQHAVITRAPEDTNRAVAAATPAAGK
ncbi:MAG: DUF2382 domain-containing protein [Terracidiphilus sp.]